MFQGSPESGARAGVKSRWDRRNLGGLLGGGGPRSTGRILGQTGIAACGARQRDTSEGISGFRISIND